MIVLITGGTGTLSKHIIPLLLENPQIERIRIISRGEHRQMQMAEEMTSPKLDFFIGDIRDKERIIRATKDCHFVFHFAAMKSVNKAEYDPWEAIQTNIFGTKNVIEACIENKVQNAIFTSTDKAVAPLNLYGASKLCAEKIFIQANIGRHRTKFGVCRYGNVLASQGSVVERWSRCANGKLPITHEEMTRFFISPKEAAQFVVDSSLEMKGSEIFIPKMKSATLINLARAFCSLQNKEFKMEDADWIGIRPGEKMHEVLVSEDEISMTTNTSRCFIRWPEHNLFPIQKRGVSISKDFTSYNAERFTQEELKDLLCQ